MNCRYKDKKKYLQIVQDELRLKGETLEEHRKHCKAKPGNCPFEKHVEEADRIASGGKPTKSSYEQTDSKFRKMRNELQQKFREANKGVDTYDEEGTLIVFDDGWQVSFQEDTTEDPTHGHYITDSDYDATVERISKETGSKPYIGFFGGNAEISFYCKSFEMAMQIARRYNQESVFDWTTYGKTYKCIFNDDIVGQNHFSDHQNSYRKSYRGPHPYFKKKQDNQEN